MSKAKAAPSAPQIQYVHIDELIPYARNSRTHDDQQVSQIAASILEFGFTNMVLRDAEGIVAGHGRVLAAAKLYKAQKTFNTVGGHPVPFEHVPCIDCDGWTKAQRKAYIIADNKLALNAGWNEDLLKLELQDLNEDGFDLSLMGFSAIELDRLLADEGSEGLTDPDDVPDAPAETCVVAGDVWILGNHRIICGDATSADDVEKLLGKVRPHLMVTDPPYGVEYDADWRNEALAGKPRADGKVGGGGRAVGKVMNDAKADWREAWALFPGDVAYVWHAGIYAGVVHDSLVACDFKIRSQIIWKKSHFAIGRGDYHWQHEPCWYAVKQKTTGHWTGDRKQTTIWEIEKPQKSETGHSTQKPVECMQRPIENNSSPGQAIYEPFSGSGTTIIACEKTGRMCFALELNPAYVEVAILRWQAFTGKFAVLESTGQTFAEVMGERTPLKSVGLKGADDKQKPKAKKAAKAKAK